MAQATPPLVLLTRPLAASNRFAQDLDLPVIISPLMETFWITPDLPTGEPDAVAFTSANGVEGFCRVSTWRGIAYCVGPTTAKLAMSKGFEARISDGNVDALNDDISRANLGRIWHPRGVHVIGEIHGAEPIIVYEQAPRTLNQAAIEALLGMDMVIVPLFSPRSSELFAQEINKIDPKNLVVLCLSQQVADEAKRQGLKAFDVAKSADGPAMRALIHDVARRCSA